MSDSPSPSVSIKLPNAPALAANYREAVWLSADGEIESISHAEAARRAQDQPPFVCHVKATASYLGIQQFDAFDLLELFAFVHPAKFCLPTPAGIARFLAMEHPEDLESQALTLIQAASRLLADLIHRPEGADDIAWAMGRGGWAWAPATLAALGSSAHEDDARKRNPTEAFRVWRRLKEWSEHAPPPQPGHIPVLPDEAEQRLNELLDANAEQRPQQISYARAAAAAFDPADELGHPRAVIAQAGTGVGKTLGYLAPSGLWADKNDGTVWVSTYTRNLQRQLDGELDRLYPAPAEKALRAVIRKGRENYLCLLNFEESVGRLAARASDAAALGLVARWVGATRDGDMVGGDFPAWLADLLGFPSAMGMTDRRGECIYSACSHYSRCFIERTVRRARRAKIVVANHALVMVQAALGGGDEAYRPARYVFDEGHHLFEAADSAFSAHLTGSETAELRRWFLGAEGRRGSRSRGLRARIEDLIVDDDEAMNSLIQLLDAVRALPGPGWQQRLAGVNPVGPTETVLSLIRQQVYARDQNADSPYDLETEAQPPVEGLISAAAELSTQLAQLEGPARSLIRWFAKQLDEKAEDLDTSTRQRIEAVARSLERRAVIQVRAWRDMLLSLAEEPPDAFVDWMSVERIDGRDFDLGLHRNWVDPTIPFAETVASTAEGLLVTSATLKDNAASDDWQPAHARTGLNHLPSPPNSIDVASPFDYAAQTKIFVITDINKNDVSQVAAALRELMLAAGGGTLGLFTSIARLRAVHRQLASSDQLAHLQLLAQHIDPLDVGTLIDIFRAEIDSCMLGTDAVRDGVDVPGRSLRLLIYDRVPWPRPTILHRARKKAYEHGRYDDVLTRLKLKQAYGRLIRQAGDRGVFVMLDRAMPTRLADAFPDGVEIERIGLAEAVTRCREFLEPLT